MRQVFVCPRCHCRHVRDEAVVDTFFSCQCGFEFYSFGNEGLTITIPSREMKRSVSDSMRRFISRTGRCMDMQPPSKAAINVLSLLRGIHPLILMEIALEKMQGETYGNYMMHGEDVETILEIINEQGKDAVIKSADGHVTIKEERTRTRKTPEINYRLLLEESLANMTDGQIAFLEDEKPLRQWQKDIMEQNAAWDRRLSGEEKPQNLNK